MIIMCFFLVITRLDRVIQTVSKALDPANKSQDDIVPADVSFVIPVKLPIYSSFMRRISMKDFKGDAC
jgi:hypothetical protein